MTTLRTGNRRRRKAEHDAALAQGTVSWLRAMRRYWYGGRSDGVENSHHVRKHK